MRNGAWFKDTLELLHNISRQGGVLDDVGGTLMRTVWRHVKVEKGRVTNPNQYADLGKQLYPKINIEYVSKENIAKHISFFDKKWENTKEIPGTHQVHCVQADESDFVRHN